MENIIANTQRSKSMPNFPIEIINKILIYVGELNNDLIILQYNPYTFGRYIRYHNFYKINMFSDLLWNIKTIMIMHQIFPNIYNLCYNEDKVKKLKAVEYRTLHTWRSSKLYYETKLRESTYKII